eukprot:TRINITY_DN32351_c0_g1_i1.p1 TRINITY_DN32351_c0_g1~~TRINITY_DN32351_c0_g1_i1.p1  ORF type:complete len:712 (+),score=153.99 TRINITY_DN32351_c0_g1_i1:69-2204(+)
MPSWTCALLVALVPLACLCQNETVRADIANSTAAIKVQVPALSSTQLLRGAGEHDRSAVAVATPKLNASDAIRAPIAASASAGAPNATTANASSALTAHQSAVVEAALEAKSNTSLPVARENVTVASKVSVTVLNATIVSVAENKSKVDVEAAANSLATTSTVGNNSSGGGSAGANSSGSATVAENQSESANASAAVTIANAVNASTPVNATTIEAANETSSQPVRPATAATNATSVAVVAAASSKDNGTSANVTTPHVTVAPANTTAVAAVTNNGSAVPLPEPIVKAVVAANTTSQTLNSTAQPPPVSAPMPAPGPVAVPVLDEKSQANVTSAVNATVAKTDEAAVQPLKRDEEFQVEPRLTDANKTVDQAGEVVRDEPAKDLPVAKEEGEQKPERQQDQEQEQEHIEHKTEQKQEQEQVVENERQQVDNGQDEEPRKPEENQQNEQQEQGEKQDFHKIDADNAGVQQEEFPEKRPENDHVLDKEREEKNVEEKPEEEAKAAAPEKRAETIQDHKEHKEHNEVNDVTANSTYSTRATKMPPQGPPKLVSSFTTVLMSLVLIVPLIIFCACGSYASFRKYQTGSQQTLFQLITEAMQQLVEKPPDVRRGRSLKPGESDTEIIVHADGTTTRKTGTPARVETAPVAAARKQNAFGGGMALSGNSKKAVGKPASQSTVTRPAQSAVPQHRPAPHVPAQTHAGWDEWDDGESDS